MRSEMVVCPWNEFWQHYSPWIPSHDVVQRGVSTLQACGFLDGNKWAEDVDPNRGPIENTAFRPLEHVSKELEGMTITGREKSYRLVHRPTQIALSTIPAGNHMIDGCVYPIKDFPQDPKAPLEMRRIASVHEYKRASGQKHVHDASLSNLFPQLLTN